MPEGMWHSARIRDWHSAVPGTLRIKKIKGHPGLRILVGKLRANGPMTVISWRFRRDRYTPEEAQAWAERHGYKVRRLIEATGDRPAGTQAAAGTKSHSRQRCMDCRKPPTKDVRWAEGMGRAWFCDTCFAKWRAKHEDDIDIVHEITAGEVPVKWGQKAGASHTGVMIALTVPIEIGRQLLTQAAVAKALPPEPAEPTELHITLAFLGEKRVQSVPRELVLQALGEVAARWPAVTGQINGEGRFLTGGEGESVPLVLFFDSAMLPAFRADIVAAVRGIGCYVAEDHGFTPHITLGYLPLSAPLPDHVLTESLPMTVPALTLAWGDSVTHLDLTGRPEDARTKMLAWAVDQLDEPAIRETLAALTGAHKSYPAPHCGSSDGGQGGSAPRESCADPAAQFAAAERAQEEGRAAAEKFRETNVQVGERVKVWHSPYGYMGVGKEPTKVWIEGEVDHLDNNELGDQMARLTYVDAKGRPRSFWFTPGRDRWRRIEALGRKTYPAPHFGRVGGERGGSLPRRLPGGVSAQMRGGGGAGYDDPDAREAEQRRDRIAADIAKVKLGPAVPPAQRTRVLTESLRANGAVYSNPEHLFIVKRARDGRIESTRPQIGAFWITPQGEVIEARSKGELYPHNDSAMRALAAIGERSHKSDDLVKEGFVRWHSASFDHEFLLPSPMMSGASVLGPGTFRP